MVATREGRKSEGRNPKSEIVVIGVGNEHRGDDAVGRVVARSLKERGLPHAMVVEQSGEGATLMELWKDADGAILIDAVHSGARPGSIHRLDAQVQPIPTEFFSHSTHAFSVGEAIELARALDQLPPRVIVYGIEGRNFEPGAPLSSEVERAAQEAADRVVQEVLGILQRRVSEGQGTRARPSER